MTSSELLTRYASIPDLIHASTRAGDVDQAATLTEEYQRLPARIRAAKLAEAQARLVELQSERAALLAQQPDTRAKVLAAVDAVQEAQKTLRMAQRDAAVLRERLSFNTDARIAAEDTIAILFEEIDRDGEKSRWPVVRVAPSARMGAGI